ncbi:hypothetical protein SAMN06296416_104174 [Pseudoxanthomonas wuyuanensis]|uniref:Uncharacterized protein n=1 Tax=Pseudoxanthomonas wuyuanensis TaxID=1073196 RepID=A0A286D7H9_9GAMM|nr:hypothetical protein SAMN06296416_104174 [Pseudoxanthomonas wuyuanensis]
MAGVRLRAKPCFASACLTHAGSSAASLPRTVPHCPGHRFLDTWSALEEGPFEVALCQLLKGAGRRAGGGAESRPGVSQGGWRGTAARLGERPARCAGPVRAAKRNEPAARPRAGYGLWDEMRCAPAPLQQGGRRRPWVVPKASRATRLRRRWHATLREGRCRGAMPRCTPWPGHQPDRRRAPCLSPRQQPSHSPQRP